MLDAAFSLLILQGLMGAFDTLYHHELKLNLPWRKSASKELFIHAIRNFFYIIVFFSLAWTEWRGAYVWLFIALLIAEVGLTLWDFVVEDNTRILPSTERITHTLLALNYGLILAFLAPTLLSWGSYSTEFSFTSHGGYSWIITLFAIGVLVWSIRDGLAHFRLQKFAENKEFSAALNLNEPGQCILISGGSGYIGSQLAQRLIDEGHDVSIVTRSIHKSAIHFSGKIRLIDDLKNINATENIDVIINLTGASIAGGFWTDKYKLELKSSRIKATRNLVSLCERLETKPKLVISASAVGYYGNQGDHICDETQDGDDSFSHELCLAWETEAEKFEALDIRLCILRLGVVFGINGGPLAKMIFPFEFGIGGILGDGKQWFSWVHLEDVFRSIAFCINKTDLSGRFNITAPDPVRNKVLTAAIGKALKRPTLLPMPVKAIKTLFGKMGEEIFLFSIRASSDKIQLEGFEFNYTEIEETLDKTLNP